jgi:L-fuconolactonase
MFGSDWPVCLLGGSYSDIVGIVESAIADWSPAEKQAIWSQTAVSAYRLEGLLS